MTSRQMYRATRLDLPHCDPQNLKRSGLTACLPLLCGAAFYYKDSGEALMTRETIEHVAGVVAAKGTDAWWQLPVEDLLPDSLRGEAASLEKVGTRGMHPWARVVLLWTDF